MSFMNIPLELRERKQWVCWRLEERHGAAKPTKMPYSPWPQGGRADVTKASTWGTFEQATAAPLNSTEVVPWDYENNRPSLSVNAKALANVLYEYPAGIAGAQAMGLLALRGTSRRG